MLVRSELQVWCSHDVVVCRFCVGPDGGDVGDVIFQVDRNLSTLIDYRYCQHVKAQNGEGGRGMTCMVLVEKNGLFFFCLVEASVSQTCMTLEGDLPRNPFFVCVLLVVLCCCFCCCVCLVLVGVSPSFD